MRRSHDYRVLQPAMVMDPNRNRSAVAFDALGLVVGTAVMGKPEESPVPWRPADPGVPRRPDRGADRPVPGRSERGPVAAMLLDEATTRVVYDLDGLPAGSRTPRARRRAPRFARETHASDPPSRRTACGSR